MTGRVGRSSVVVSPAGVDVVGPLTLDEVVDIDVDVDEPPAPPTVVDVVVATPSTSAVVVVPPAGAVVLVEVLEVLEVLIGQQVVLDVEVEEDVEVGTAAVVVEVPGPVAHAGRTTVLVSRVTAPLRARRRPWTVAPVIALIDVRARTVPVNVESVPRVAELPICQ